MSMFKWEVVDPAPGQAVLPMQRLPWGKTIGLGAQVEEGRPVTGLGRAQEQPLGADRPARPGVDGERQSHARRVDSGQTRPRTCQRLRRSFGRCPQ